MKIQRKSITDQVYDILQREIETGALRPGDRIREDALAAKLEVSKTPLRIALHQLKESGLVRIDGRQGIYMALPSTAELAQLIDMREVLEGLAARRAAALVTPKQIERLRACFAPFDDENLAARRQAYADADHKFHGLLISLAGSDELSSKLRIIILRLHMNRLRMSFTRGHDLLPIHREHLAIIDALASGDGSMAEERVRAHIRNIPRQDVLAPPEALPQETDAA